MVNGIGIGSGNKKMIKRELHRLFAAFLFFSRIPIPSANTLNEQHFQKATRYLPWVGFFVSVAGAFIMYTTSRILPKPLAILLGMSTTLLLTGAIHEDGLADVCDGFGGGYSKQHILDIMKDSHIGTFGVIGLIISFLFRFIALTEMPPFFMAVFFVTGNILSRFTLVTIMHQYSYVRDDATSKAKTVIGSIGYTDLFIASLPVIALFYFIGNFTLMLLIIPLWIAKWLLSRYFKHKIGGYTGDCLGAIQQVTEIIFYLTALIWLKFTW
jgi:adenosylcobinamide-GDP ribazoletransferase